MTEFRWDEWAVPTTLEIYDGAGRLVDLIRPSGSQVEWTPPLGARQGVYFARLKTRETTSVVKFVVIH